MQSFVQCQGDSWTRTLEALKRILQALALAPEGDDTERSEDFSAFVPNMERLGLRTAEMHKALATPTDDPAFKAETLSLADVQQEVEEVRDLAGRVFARLQRLDGEASKETKAETERLLDRRQDCLALIEDLAREPSGAIKIRIHGDYHLGRTLIVKDDVAIVGFGGSPSASIEQRRAKTSPLRDVASMLRSFAYVAAAAKRDVARLVPDPDAAAARLSQQLVELSQIFVRSYMETARGSPIWIEDGISRRRLLFLYLLAKAFHEIDDAVALRSDWIDIAIEGVNVILDEAAKRG
jgi:maltose alpha-D-glucosyltransferase/alpha-amylase